jgi:hypothetical protein
MKIIIEAESDESVDTNIEINSTDLDNDNYINIATTHETYTVTLDELSGAIAAFEALRQANNNRDFRYMHKAPQTSYINLNGLDKTPDDILEAILEERKKDLKKYEKDLHIK